MESKAQTASHAPIRGTQSFVGMMSFVWKRPGLTGIEVVSRWIAWLPLLLCASIYVGALGMDVHLNLARAQAMWSESQTSFTLLEHGAYLFSFQAGAFALGTLPLLACAALWGVISGFGRALLLRRIHPQLLARRFTLCVLAMSRVVLMTALLAGWLLVLVAGWIHFVQGPQSRGEYPGYVPGFALVLILTVLLFVLWSATSWIFRLAPMLAMGLGVGPVEAVRVAWKTGPLRGKLIEINLVMGVVKLGLIVWAMAISASPLPFANNETEGFLHAWWAGTFVVWVVASDYFHVVRQAAYVRLAQAYDFLPGETAPEAEAAS